MSRGDGYTFLREMAHADRSWMVDAACRGAGPDLFYSDRNRDCVEALLVCMRCPVIEKCREYGARFGYGEGCWGGLTPHQLRAWKRRHKATTLRRQVGPKQPLSTRPTPARHGTRSKYVVGCRCDACYLADSKYQAARYRRRFDNDPLRGPDDFKVA